MSPTPTAPATLVTPVLTVEDATFGYVPEQAVFTRLSAVLAPGRLTALLGPNAVGKSTLLKAVLGLVQPWSGRVTHAGRALGSLSPVQRAACLAYVPQRASVSFAFTVEQVVSMGRFAVGADDQAIEKAIGACDLNAIRERIFRELSGGQQQRVLLARALAQVYGPALRQKVMLLDEPVSAMDLWHVHQTLRLLRELTQQGLSALVVLHDLNLAARYADDIWLMTCGGFAAVGPWQDVLRPEVLEPVYRMKLPIVNVDEAGRPVFSAQLCDRLSGAESKGLTCL